MNVNLNNLTAPLYFFDRLAERAPETLRRYAGQSAPVAAFGVSLPGVCREYRAEYAAVTLFEERTRALTKATNEEVKALDAYVRAWLAPLGLHLGIDLGPASTSRVPLDIVAGAERTGARLRAALQRDGVQLAYGERLLAEVENRAQRVAMLFNESQTALAALQDRKAHLRQTAARLNRELVAFRRVLRAELGTQHRDYQALRSPRMQRVQGAEAGDGPSGPPRV